MKSIWQTKRLEDVSEYISRGISPKYTDGRGILVLNQKCIRNHVVNFQLARKHDLNSRKTSTGKSLKVGDILINSTGVGTLGRVAQVKSLIEDATVDSHITIVRPKNGLFDTDFLGYVLISIEEEIQKAGEGASGQTELSRNRVKDFIISFPESIKEQRR